MIERAEIGVDGNCGFALLGEDLQQGEAEFVLIDTAAQKYSSEWEDAACRAATKALSNLHKRLPDKHFSYYLGPSHPRFV